MRSSSIPELSSVLPLVCFSISPISWVGESVLVLGVTQLNNPLRRQFEYSCRIPSCDCLVKIRLTIFDPLVELCKDQIGHQWDEHASRPGNSWAHARTLLCRAGPFQATCSRERLISASRSAASELLHANSFIFSRKTSCTTNHDDAPPQQPRNLCSSLERASFPVFPRILALQSCCGGIQHVLFLDALFLEVGQTILGLAHENFALLHLNIDRFVFRCALSTLQRTL